MPIGLSELAMLALLVSLVLLIGLLMWMTAGWAAKGRWPRKLAGFLLFWVLTTIIGALLFLALTGYRGRRLAAEASAADA